MHMKYRKLRIAFSAACLIACVLLIVLWVRSYWRFDQFIHSVSTTDYFACTSIQGEIQMGMSSDPALRAVFRQDTWIRKDFAMIDWQKALDGPEAYFPASSPGPFIAPTVRMPRFAKRSFVTSTPSNTAYQIIIPYWMLFFLYARSRRIAMDTRVAEADRVGGQQTI